MNIDTPLIADVNPKGEAHHQELAHIVLKRALSQLGSHLSILGSQLPIHIITSTFLLILGCILY